MNKIDCIKFQNISWCGNKDKILEIPMQTLTIKVKDDLVSEVIKVLEQFKDNIQITKDRNLEFDPYFYERQKKLQQIRDDISRGEMLTHDFETSMDELIKELER